MEGDFPLLPRFCPGTFQSTPSAWRETRIEICVCWCFRYFNPLPPHGGRREREGAADTAAYFNPLPPHGGRPADAEAEARGEGISIHSLRMEGDMQYTQQRPRAAISIHSLRMEGDPLLSGFGTGRTYFNPLPPHGGRQLREFIRFDEILFQSTPSAWRETLADRGAGNTTVISIHSLRMEGDY